MKNTIIKNIALALAIAVAVASVLALCSAITQAPLTVNEVLEMSECGYIVKDLETWSVLEPTEYLDEVVVEIAVCDDTENTLCIFISLDENEERIIRRNIYD